MNAPLRLSRVVADGAGAGLAGVRAEVARRVAAGDDITDLSGDGPLRMHPRGVIDTTAKAWRTVERAGRDPRGSLELRAAVARHWSLLSGGRPVNADHVVVAPTPAFGAFAACMALFESGDHVAVASPMPSSWEFFLRVARATPVPVPGDPEWSLKISVADVERVSDARMAGLVLHSPANPTGAVYTRSELKALLEWTTARNIWVIADESLRPYHFGSGPAPSVLDLPDELLRRTVVVGAVGTVLSGLGVGASLAPLSVAQAQARVLGWMAGQVPPPIQEAALALLTDDRHAGELDGSAEGMRRKRDVAVEFLRVRVPGMEFIDPLGGLFLFFRIDGVVSGALAHADRFCEDLLASAGVALAPGTAFGDHRWVRLTFSVPERQLERGLGRIEEFVLANALEMRHEHS